MFLNGSVAVKAIRRTIRYDEPSFATYRVRRVTNPLQAMELLIYALVIWRTDVTQTMFAYCYFSNTSDYLVVYFCGVRTMFVE